jgi:hypothetical protein
MNKKSKRSMNKESKRRLTEWLGEEVCKNQDCDCLSYRTFTTPDDFFAVFDRLVKLYEWDDFEDWAGDTQSFGLKTDTGEYRLCWLVGEWTKVQKKGV